MRFVVTANLLGFPAISVPVSINTIFLFVSCSRQQLYVNNSYIQVGYDKQGLPIGLQIIGRPWCEATVLRLAAAVEVSATFQFHLG